MVSVRFSYMLVSMENNEKVSTICIDVQIVPNAAFGVVKSKYKEAAEKHGRPRPHRSKNADPLDVKIDQVSYTKSKMSQL